MNFMFESGAMAARRVGRLMRMLGVTLGAVLCLCAVSGQASAQATTLFSVQYLPPVYAPPFYSGLPGGKLFTATDFGLQSTPLQPTQVLNLAPGQELTDIQLTITFFEDIAPFNPGSMKETVTITMSGFLPSSTDEFSLILQETYIRSPTADTFTNRSLADIEANPDLHTFRQSAANVASGTDAQTGQDILHIRAAGAEFDVYDPFGSSPVTYFDYDVTRCPDFNYCFPAAGTSATGVFPEAGATSGGGGNPGGGSTPVPEPATWAMMLAGFGMAGLRLARRRA